MSLWRIDRLLYEMVRVCFQTLNFKSQQDILVEMPNRLWDKHLELDTDVRETDLEIICVEEP